MKVNDMQIASLPGHSTEAGHVLAQSVSVAAMADQSSKVRDAAKCILGDMYAIGMKEYGDLIRPMMDAEGLGAMAAATSLRKSAGSAFQQVLISAAAEEIQMVTGGVE